MASNWISHRIIYNEKFFFAIRIQQQRKRKTDKYTRMPNSTEWKCQSLSLYLIHSNAGTGFVHLFFPIKHSNRLCSMCANYVPTIGTYASTHICLMNTLYSYEYISIAIWNITIVCNNMWWCLLLCLFGNCILWAGKQTHFCLIRYSFTCVIIFYGEL